MDEFQSRFMEVVKAARPQASAEDLDAMATAAPFTARRALELHMVDRVGYLRDAFQAVLDRAGLPEARLVAYRKGGGERTNPYSLALLLSRWEQQPLFLDPGWARQTLETGPLY